MMLKFKDLRLLDKAILHLK